jgi:hypothetical protein
MTANEALTKAKKLFGKNGDIRSDGELYEVGIWPGLATFVRLGAGTSWTAAFDDAACHIAIND